MMVADVSVLDPSPGPEHPICGDRFGPAVHPDTVERPPP